MDAKTTSNLMQDLGRITSALPDPVLRRQVEEACLALDVDTQVLPVTEFRDDIKNVRERVHQGGVTLIADRADVRAASDTTVVLSLEKLQRVIADIVEKSAETYRKRGNPADLLAGLPPVPAEALAFEIDFESEARKEADWPLTDIKL